MFVTVIVSTIIWPVSVGTGVVTIRVPDSEAAAVAASVPIASPETADDPHVNPLAVALNTCDPAVSTV